MRFIAEQFDDVEVWGVEYSDAIDKAKIMGDELGLSFNLVRGDLLKEWEPKANVIGLGRVRDHYSVGTRNFIQKTTRNLENIVSKVPVTTGATLRGILHEWAIRHAQLEQGDFFNNSFNRLLELSHQ